MDKSIQQMKQDLARANYAKSTQEKYLKTATRFAAWCNRPLADVCADELRRYAEIIEARPVTAPTKIVELAAIRFLYRITLSRPDSVSFLVYPKRHRPLPTVLSEGEIDVLIRAIRVPTYQAIAMVMYGSGLRLGEALALEVGDIDGPRQVLRVRHGKGNKPREAKLSPVLYQWLRAYWARERPPLPYLFASKRTGKPPRQETMAKALAHAAKSARIKKHVRPHALRHSFATHALEQGADVSVVQQMLGHASILSTMHYARVTQKLVRETPSPLDLLALRRRR